MATSRVAELERQIQQNPEDLNGRKKLMLYYQGKAHEAAFRGQKLWFVEHHPEDEAAIRANPVSDPAGDRQAKTLWLAAISRPDVSPAVLGNAAAFFENYDKPLAERLLLRAEAADPNGRWSARLYRLYASAITGRDSGSDFAASVRKRLAESSDARFLGSMAFRMLLSGNWRQGGQERESAFLHQAASYAERALTLDPNQESAHSALVLIHNMQWNATLPPGTFQKPVANWSDSLAAMPASERFRWLAKMSEAAYLHGEWADNEHDTGKAKEDWEWARKYAQQALELAAKFTGDPNYGTAVYQANVTLGMVAMRVDQDKNAAIDYLLAASKAPATDELAYNIQDLAMKLPVALLKYGGLDGREAVIEYLERFGKVVHRHDLPLLENAAQLRNGYMPVWYQYQAAKLK